MLKRCKKSFVFLAMTIVPLIASAQMTSNYLPPLLQYHDGMELFNKEKYGAAQEKFNQLVASVNTPAEMQANAKYYKAVCALLLFNNDAENLGMDFINNHPENPKVNTTYFLLGNYFFKNKKYKDALAAFENVEIELLNETDLNEYYFKTGYSYFNDQNYYKAKKAFHEIIGKDSKYFAPANYYFAHIAYTEKNYETASIAFRKLLSDENYGKIAPYYLLQIYYYQHKYDDIIILAPALLDSATSKRVPEIARITAEAYYQTERYAEAIPYLDIYLQKNTMPLTREDYYMVGYTYYKVNDCTKSLQYLNKVSTSQNDSLSQLTCYHLAECYLKTNQKQFAMNMFASAYKMDFDKEIQENAMFNYAKMAYETAYNPYNEAINVFNQYIEKYPNSSNIDEAYEYLSNIYLSTKNYKDAMSALERIKKRNTTLNGAYQKIAYLRGIELFNNLDLDGSMVMLAKSLKYPLNTGIEIQSYYWLAEACYRLEKFDSAVINYQMLQAIPGAFGTELYTGSYYGLGYSYFKKKNYSSALNNFKKYIAEAKSKNTKVLNDAYNRTGDCYFMEKDFTNAIENYDAGIMMKLIDVDYALYQKSLAQGAMAKLENKASTLIYLVDTYRNSNYRAPALFELANTYQNLNNNTKAIDYYDKLLREYPNSSYVSQSMLKKGMIYFNASQDEQALTVLKKVVSDFPGTAESKEALVSIRNIYVDMDKVEEFFKYVKELPFASVSDSEQDSITYIAVENRYMRNDCENATIGFKDYISKFPDGVYQLDAHFYLAECQYRASLSDDALKNYQFVISKPRSKFTETSLLNAANISYTKKDFSAAVNFYSDLEKNAEYKENIITAITGQMRSNFRLALYQTTINNARRLMGKEKLPEELIAESHLTIAKSALAIDSVSLGMAELIVVGKITKSEMAAEAKYLLAEIYFKNGNYEESQKSAFDLINQIPSYDYWVAKAFILLADNYLKTGNVHQAKYTLKSIIDNYEGADLIKIAQEKLDKIVADEKLEEQRKAEESLRPQNETDPALDINNIK